MNTRKEGNARITRKSDLLLRRERGRGEKGKEREEIKLLLPLSQTCVTFNILIFPIEVVQSRK